MLRPITLATAFGLVLCTAGFAQAATYCAEYVGGSERVGSGARSQCNFATLKACRTSVRERGGGHCYKKAQMR
ncbi:MAG TPA: hypothetical protein VHA77_04280 [Xanthobacteraceae bacterium]|jgi:hypothetical protein|nr:hypothetical protein [Xanthobacteraceae bacterium]